MSKVKENLGAVIFSILASLVPIIAGLILWDKLPAQLPVHFNVQGVADNYFDKGTTIFVLFGIMFLMQIFVAFIPAIGKPSPKEITDRTYVAILWIVPVTNMAIAIMIYGTGMGQKTDVGTVMLALIGIFFLGLGNVLPKVRQNKWFGLRLKWTLESKRNWDKTNRVAGWGLCICGLYMLVGAVVGVHHVFGEIGFVYAIGMPILLLVTVLSVYSYVYFVKHSNEEGYFDK